MAKSNNNIKDNYILTIAVINYNGEKYLDDCLASLPKLQAVQYVLIDGGSVDQSINIIENYKEKFDKILSEKDSGQSDALNKSINFAKGMYYTWINSDDMVNDRHLHELVNVLKESNIPWHIAGTEFVNSESKLIYRYIQPYSAKFMNRWGFVSVGGPASILKTSLLREAGGFDSSLFYCMDVDLWLRLWIKGYRYKSFKKIIYKFRIHEESKTSHAFSTRPVDKFVREREKILKKYKRKESITLAITRRILSLLFIQTYWNLFTRIKRSE